MTAAPHALCGTDIATGSPLEAIELQAYAAILPAEQKSHAEGEKEEGEKTKEGEKKKEEVEGEKEEEEGRGAARLELVASMEGTLQSAFGVAAMQLSFLVIKQRLYSSHVPRILADAVLSLGAACSSATIDVAHACMEGRAAVGFAPARPDEGVLVGRVPALHAARLLRLAGVRDQSWGGVSEVVQGVLFPLGSSVGYALREHHVMARDDDTAGKERFSLPAGMSGEGLAVLGALGSVNCTVRWHVDVKGGRIRMQGQLPAVDRGAGFKLSKASGAFHGSPEKGPVFKLLGVAGEPVQAYLQGHVSLGNLSSFVLFKARDSGLEGRIEGHFGAGLHARVQLSADLGDPQAVEWAVAGEATETGDRKSVV